MNTRISPTPQAAAEDAAHALALAAHEAVSQRGAFYVALSGGSTPKFMYQALRDMDLPWAQTHVYFSDERTVPPSSDQSNFKLAHDELLSHVPVPEGQIHRMVGERDPQTAASNYAAVLPEQFDVLLLGMGDDGHTASLFPGTDGLNGLGRVIANRVPKLDTWRVTFTFHEINAARQRWMLVAGANKAVILRQVQAGEGEYPVGKVEDPIWFLDAAAASELT